MPSTVRQAFRALLVKGVALGSCYALRHRHLPLKWQLRFVANVPSRETPGRDAFAQTPMGATNSGYQASSFQWGR